MANAHRKAGAAAPQRAKASPGRKSAVSRGGPPKGGHQVGESAPAQVAADKAPRQTARSASGEKAGRSTGTGKAPQAAPPADLKEMPQAHMSKKRLLTEAEILQMSEKDYMNEDQLAFFKNRLETLQEEILRNAGQTTENLRETVIVPDPADRATIEEEHALELRTRDRERKLLKKVQQSLARIESGEYGWCEETGEPIGVPRLLARPTATLSLEAQERRELRQKLFGD